MDRVPAGVEGAWTAWRGVRGVGQSRRFEAGDRQGVDPGPLATLRGAFSAQRERQAAKSRRAGLHRWLEATVPVRGSDGGAGGSQGLGEPLGRRGGLPATGGLGGGERRGDLHGVPAAGRTPTAHEIDQHVGTAQRRDPSSDAGGAHLSEQGLVSTTDTGTIGRDAREMVDRLLPSHADGGTDATIRRHE